LVCWKEEKIRKEGWKEGKIVGMLEGNKDCWYAGREGGRKEGMTESILKKRRTKKDSWYNGGK